MHTIVLTLVVIIGFLLLSRVDPKASQAERWGFATPVGLGAVTLLMFAADWAGLSLTRPLIWGILVVLLLGSVALLWPQRKMFIGGFTKKPDFTWINALWIVAFCVIAYMEYANLMKTLYFPAYDRDSLAGFDTIGFVAAQEHTFRGMSIFAGNYMPSIHGPGSYISYMPGLQLSYTLVYLMGAETSKAVPALLWLGFLLGLYGLSRRFFRTCTGRTWGGDTAAILVVLLLMFATEMVSFSSLSGTNVPQAVVAAPGLMYVVLWYRAHRSGDTSNFEPTTSLYIGCILLALSCWLRLEGFIFSFIAFCVVLVGVLLRPASLSLRQKVVLPLLPIVSLLPIVLFNVYTKVFALTAESTIIARPYWDGAKAQTVFDHAISLLCNTQYYGPAFALFVIALVLSIPLLCKGRGVMTYLAIVAAVAMYFVVLYQIDYKWDTIENVLNYSAKRFLFCFVPMVLICALCQGNLARLIDWTERKCSLRKA